MRVTPLFVVGLILAQTAAAQTSSVIAPSYKFPQVRPPVHKIDQPMALNLQTLRYHPEDIEKVTMAVYTDQNGGAPAASWEFGPREQIILLERLALLEEPNVTVPDTYTAPRKYTSIELTFNRKDGRKMSRLAVFKNTAVIEGERNMWVDPDGRLEKWLFSTAKKFEDRVFANTALNVQTFRDCEWAGNLVVDTSNPNQCILPDGTLFLKIDPDDMPADPKQTTYDACYKAKRPVLDEFPRKCVVPGGRVLVEPARLKKEEAPAPVKKAAAKKAKPKAKAAAPVVAVPKADDLLKGMPQTMDMMPDSDVPAPVNTPATSSEQKVENKKAVAKAATAAKAEDQNNVAAPGNAKVEKLPEKTAASKPTPVQPVVVNTETGPKVVTKTPSGTTTVAPVVTPTAAPVNNTPPKPASSTKTTTLPAVETPDTALQVVPPKKPVEDPIAPSTND